ncbi:alanine/glycine:cation symporter family protein [Lawsonibacter faecis]|uniref:Alanine:cation symporter family protein n=1 Tax=Lawsonibacter faecis TaxID=2763052 RepID=A0A8J6JAW0_9FIRM|nr:MULTISPECIES: alanine/glycine:cation symporter family protein [Oscillospiraceae]MTQ96392.1 amino acid carrier protein [Pseudoflavonifractor sp. BIOML-A16]MTR05166.1 amino acid carrier protein [Pseudoflavonifractor sp. BIOML-A15]MTR32498.1 amino acid carrier protein [Pseudoflavonifractor sp. BIOML-A14]MTR73781.1 amino acid carrier protein [Pseudoflavonifractor sp. BIOML-A18]MTS63141.1 amino acid carrier protein [Pseudoflavonifractor sp. BIOML-A5]MTS70521.1 amino acid carrier protein [Pseudo
MAFLARVGDFIWNPWLLGLFLLTGLYFSIRTGFFQVFDIGLWFKTTLGSILKPSKQKKGGGITQFQALSTALASTIGTGSIAGVATAIFYGGPGAVFWMWVSAFLSMMTGCIEKTLAVRYREPSPEGGWQGGPMCYMEKGLHSRFLAVLFSVCCVCASLGGGNLVQSNSIATALEHSFGWDRLAVGVVTAVLTGIVILGGIGRIGKVSEKLVPAMALLFIGGGAVVLAVNAAALPGALESIVMGAVAPKAALGGALGYGVAAAMRFGVARGVFTNEAGMGSSAMAHAASDVKEPAEQGMWGVFEVFVATLVVCSITALVILTTGVYDPAAALAAIEGGAVTNAMLGAPLSAAAFGTVFGRWGGVFVSVCLLLFAFTSLLGWSYYGERGLSYLTGTTRWKWLYRVFFMVMVVLGSVGDMSSMWQLADIFNGLMALPNLAALLLLSPEALRLLGEWKRSRRRVRGR